MITASVMLIIRQRHLSGYLQLPRSCGTLSAGLNAGLEKHTFSASSKMHATINI